MRNRHRGFTLIELLVVLAVIGVLLSLTLPAVQQARESARRAMCRDRLRQLGLALHNYHDTRLVLPAGALVLGPSFPALSGWGWGAMILPHVDQSALYGSLDFDRGTTVGGNVQQVRVSLPVWRCPSDISESFVATPSWAGPVVQAASGNYCGAGGMLSGMSSVQFSLVTDGLSQTLMLGERVTNPSGASSTPYTAGWYGILASQTSYVFTSMPYTDVVAAFRINSSFGSTQCFSSRHVGGAYFVMGDGAVRFVTEHIDGKVFEALGTPNGQDVAEF